MNSERPGRAEIVIGPAGKPLTVNNLPSPETKRWVMSRKADVVTAVRRGLIGRNDACDRYGISDEEFLSWERLIDAHGLRGLQTTRLQQYRGGPPRIREQANVYFETRALAGRGGGYRQSERDGDPAQRLP